MLKRLNYNNRTGRIKSVEIQLPSSDFKFISPLLMNYIEYSPQTLKILYKNKK